MARQISVEIQEGVKELITQITGFKDGTNKFNTIQKYFHDKLKKSDTMYFLNKTEVDRNIAGMAEKFNFHGFFSQAKALEEAYNGYITPTISKSQLTSHFNVVKFLLCMSEKPTSKFFDNPEEFEVKSEPIEEEINWGEYLKEGIECLIPRFDDSSDNSEISSVDGEQESPDQKEIIDMKVPLVISCDEKDVVMNLRANREELLNTIQHTWYNTNHFHDKPSSERREANIGILWENYLEDQAMGLVRMKKSKIISEYKVIREILWQLWGPHTSTVFCFEGNSLTIRNDVTISSVRADKTKLAILKDLFQKVAIILAVDFRVYHEEPIFQNLVYNEILPYIHLLELFRDFSQCLDINSKESTMIVPQTYRSYNMSLKNIIEPVYLKLSKLEDKVREQETTYTLLNLAEDLRFLLEPVVLLKKIHNIVIMDFKNQNNIVSASTLLTRLHDSLQYSINKLDQDLRVTLYIETLFYYFTLIDSWFMKNDFHDYSEEFLIVNKNYNINQPRQTWDDNSEGALNSDYCKLNFDVASGMDETSKNDEVLKIITGSVLQIGRNLHLLRLLGDFSIPNENNETIYEEFVRKVLEELCKFFNHDQHITNTSTNQTHFEEEISYKFPVVCTEDSNKPTEMDKLENLVDTSDGFLMLAFRDFFKCETKITEPEKLTLYEQISKITTSFFPVNNFFEKILNSILKGRFTVSGLRVKNILVEKYLLEKQFRFLRHIFLFFENIIFPFYRRFFIGVYAQNKNWGNEIWLKSHLQDIIIDLYPEFYEKCIVKVDDNWKNCNDALEACNMLSVNIDNQWPLNIIISEPQIIIYKQIFKFIFTIKWGLYTLNHLSFTDLEPKRQNSRKISKADKFIFMKLKYLRFVMINLLNSIHHYIFSFVFAKCLQKFELDFEKANDLLSIMASHSEFITNTNKLIMEIKNCGKKESAFGNMNKCIKLLKRMWENTGSTTPEKLYQIYENYKLSFNAINPIISPVYLFDY